VAISLLDTAGYGPPLAMRGIVAHVLLTVPRGWDAFEPPPLMPRFPLPAIAPPEPVTASCLLHPIIWPNGRTINRIETSRRYSANDMPLVRDAANRPMTLADDIGFGSIVRLAIW
jgi:hypothetical protein